MDGIQYFALAALFGGALIYLIEMVFPSVAPKTVFALSSSPSSTSNGSISSSSTSSQRSPRLRTAYEVFDAYKQLSPSALLAPLTPDFTMQVLPSSLGMPARSKTDYGAHAGMVTSIFSSFAMLPIPGQVFEDPAANAVIAHCKMVGELTNGLGPWENECIITLRFDESGTKVVSHREFVDSARAALLRQKLMAGGKGPGGPQQQGQKAADSFTK